METPKYKLVGKPQGGYYEKIDVAYSLEDAKHLLQEYRRSFPKGWHIIYYNIED